MPPACTRQTGVHDTAFRTNRMTSEPFKASLRLTLVLVSISLADGSRAEETLVKPGDDVGPLIDRLKPGDTLHFTPGVYTQALVLRGVRGTEAAPITLKADAGVEIKDPHGSRNGIFLSPAGGGCAWIVIDGFRITGARLAGILIGGSHHVTVRNTTCGDNRRWGIQTWLCDHITVENCHLYGSKTEHGLYFSTTENPVARNNRIHDNAGCGIHMNGDRHEGGDGLISNGLIERNVIYNCGEPHGGAGLNMDGVETTVVRNNLLYNNHSGGITVFHQGGIRSGTHNTFYHNTVYFQPGEGRFGLELRDGATDQTVVNNIFVGGMGPALWIDSVSLKGLKSDHNVWFQHGGALPVELDGKRLTFADWQRTRAVDTYSLCVDPHFVDVTKGDFRLRTDSPGVDRGTPLDEVTVDVTGKKRPAGQAPDIGACER